MPKKNNSKLKSFIEKAFFFIIVFGLAIGLTRVLAWTNPTQNPPGGNAIFAGVPSGVIVMWSGSVANIPSGWALCDGNNGTPNLMDRFIVGAGSSYGVGNIGGSTTHAHSAGSLAGPLHSHSGATGGHTLTIAEMPSHNHGVYGHTGGFPDGTAFVAHESGGTNNTIVQNTGGGQSHSHTISADGNGAVTGTSASASSLPPYYAMAYIMKL